MWKSLIVTKADNPERIGTGVGKWKMEIESWRKFLLIVFAFLLVVNAFFAVIYYAIGVEFLVGMEMKLFGYNFLEAYYFSFQTFTTVGYGHGHVYAIVHRANLVATLESVLGWMYFALVTGLLYGRFSKARLLYSEKALISPYQQVRR